MHEDVRFWLRQQESWHDFRQFIRYGWVESWRRFWYWPQILRTPPIRTDPSRAGCSWELHTMCHPGDWLLMVWMLKSLLRQMRDRPSLIIHIQRPLLPSRICRIREHFPDARVVLPEEAQARVIDELLAQNAIRSLRWRLEQPIIQKLFDVQILSQASSITWVDADVLFFGTPAELVPDPVHGFSQWAFQRDHVDSFSLTHEAARQDLGVELLPFANAGIVTRPREVLALRRVEQFLSHAAFGKKCGLMEQTLQVLCASEAGVATHFPPTYELTLQPHLSPLGGVCRHYAGPSRRFITRDGIQRLIRNGLLES